MQKRAAMPNASLPANRDNIGRANHLLVIALGYSVSLGLAGWTARSTQAEGVPAVPGPDESTGRPALISIGSLPGRVAVVAERRESGDWGLRVEGAGMASLVQPHPVCIEWHAERAQSPLPDADASRQDARGPTAPPESRQYAAAYHDVRRMGGIAVGRARIDTGMNAVLAVEDRWFIKNHALRLDRKVTVHGNAEGGFLSAVTWRAVSVSAWTEVEWFVPGVLYGGFDHLSDHAIGGRAHYQPGAYAVRIREDRLPTPLVVARFRDGRSVSVLHPSPRGDTTADDALDVVGTTLVNPRFQFGSIGAEELPDGLQVGFWYPGTEGQVTYAGNTYPGGHLHRWRRRYHPLIDGFTQTYQVAFRFSSEDDFADTMRQDWRWAWNELAPPLNYHDIDQARVHIAGVLSACVVETDGRAGIPNFIDTGHRDPRRADRKAIMGFTGKNLEAAWLLLREAALDPTAPGAENRRRAEAVIASFLRMPVAPPAGEGFDLDDGRWRCAIGDQEVFLRSFGDDIKALLRAYRDERDRGREHPEWLAWCLQFADWLLTQQQPAGGFPRSWEPGTGRVVSASPNASFSAVPMLCLATALTGDDAYLHAAEQAGAFCWANGQAQGRFVGGTIDNPDVLDKEAGTLSLEAYLALYEATRESRWLDHARVAADFAETWIYLWNVPMPADLPDPDPHWKHGAPTTGLQLISSGHSLVDAYMAFDADEFARLFQLTGDLHYLQVARLLLHNTKTPVALPGRTYDLVVPGWQQEHWSLSPPRGYGLHRGWLPWVATSQLNGIFGVLDLPPPLRESLLHPADTF